MLKKLSVLLSFAVILFSIDSRAADNLTLTKFTHSSQVPGDYMALGGGSAMSGKTYKDDEGKVRSDKIYYTISHSYNSTYKMSDISKIMNPASGRLGSLFADTQVNKSSKVGSYDVMMEISTPLKDFECGSSMTFKNALDGKKNVYTYSFTNFNMVFTDMVIKVEVEEVGPSSKIKLSQIVAVKGSTYDKLKTYFAIGKFEKAMKENIRKLKDGVGGI